MKFILQAAVAVTLITLIIILIIALCRVYGDFKTANNKQGFWHTLLKDVLVPFVGPAVLAGVGLWFSIQLDKERNAEAENQSKAAILRQRMTATDQMDVSFFIAIGDRLTGHLQRYKKHLKEARAKGVRGQDLQSYLDKNALFDEKATYFFYGMFRVARVNFLATKGYTLYPRIWMEGASEGLMDHVVTDFIGTKESDLSASPEEEAALFKYFSASKATYATSERSPESIPNLFEFSLILDKRVPAPKATADNPYYALHVKELRDGFERFQARLRNGTIQTDEIIITFEAITGLDDYAFNTLFSAWYKQFDRDPPLNLSNYLCQPPPDFLPYLPVSFEAENQGREKQEWCEERKKAWKVILENVPADLKKGDAQAACPGS